MKPWATFAGIAITGIAMTGFTLACGGGEDEIASQAPADAGKAPAASAKMPDVSAAPQDPVKECLALAAQQRWSEALDPCTQAAKARPTDLRIKHAVQQAQAAAGS